MIAPETEHAEHHSSHKENRDALLKHPKEEMEHEKSYCVSHCRSCNRFFA